MRAIGKSSLFPKFLQTFWAPFGHGVSSTANLCPTLATPQVIAGPYSDEVHHQLNDALKAARCPEQSSSLIWNGQYFSFPADHQHRQPHQQPHQQPQLLYPQQSNNPGGSIMDSMDPPPAAIPSPPEAKPPLPQVGMPSAKITKMQGGDESIDAANEAHDQPLHAIHNYFVCMFSAYDIHSSSLDFQSWQHQSTPGKAVGSFLLKQERPLLGEWRGSNPYLKVDFRLSFETRSDFFLHLNYHCNFHQQLVEGGCPLEVAQHVIQPRPSAFVLHYCKEGATAGGLGLKEVGHEEDHQPPACARIVSA